MRKKLTLLIFVVLAATGVILVRTDHAATPPKPKSTTKTTTTTTQQSDEFNKHQYSLTDPTSIWVIANKQHPLQPADYIPADLTIPTVSLASPGAANMQMRVVTATALEQMFAAAKLQAINLEVVSAYRSYSYQQSIYNGYVQSSGQAAADAESARPGYSEHQTGLAVDIGATDGVCSLEQCFGATPEGEWLAANSYKYGFILRYTADKVAITGYEYEPWHFRYVGTALSNEMHKDGIETLEEFFGVSGGAVYKAEP